jgi:SAM-dependent methyltransferase
MWSAVAGSWAEYADYTVARHTPETSAMFAATAPVRGEHVLELACGAGGLGLAAAQLVAPTGRVVQSDVSPEMTMIAAARSTAAGTRSIEVRVLDLEEIAEPDASYDVVLCQHGLQFTVEPIAAANQIARVLRPGGRMAVSVWGPMEANPWLALVMDAVRTQVGHQVPPPGMPGPFSLSQPDQLAEVFEAAGLCDVDVQQVSVPLEADGFESWWARTSSLTGPLKTILSRIDDQGATAIREHARASLADFATPNGYHLPGLSLVAAARRPGMESS